MSISTHKFVAHPCLECVSLAIMSPLTAKVKYPHYGRQSEFEAEAMEEVASPNGVGGASHIERGQ